MARARAKHGSASLSAGIRRLAPEAARALEALLWATVQAQSALVVPYEIDGAKGAAYLVNLERGRPAYLSTLSGEIALYHYGTPVPLDKPYAVLMSAFLLAAQGYRGEAEKLLERAIEAWRGAGEPGLADLARLAMAMIHHGQPPPVDPSGIPEPKHTASLSITYEQGLTSYGSMNIRFLKTHRGVERYMTAYCDDAWSGAEYKVKYDLATGRLEAGRCTRKWLASGVCGCLEERLREAARIAPVVAAYWLSLARLAVALFWG